MELALDLRRTRDRLQWAPKVWRRENTGLKKVKSDPGFTSSFTKLPPILAAAQNKSRALAAAGGKTNRQGSTNLSTTRRLLAGHSTQVGFHQTANQGAAAAPALGVSKSEGSLPKQTTHRREAAPHSEDIVEQTKSFIAAFDSVHKGITSIHSSVQHFQGHKKGEREAGTKANASHHGHADAGKEETEDEGESLKDRILKYRFVRKIEPPAEPLEKPTEIEFPDPVDGHMIHHNTSPEVVQAYYPASKAKALRKMGKRRDEKHEMARIRREKEELEFQRAAELKTLSMAERMRSARERGDSSLATKEAFDPQRSLQARKWQGALCMIGFMQICRNLKMKYKETRDSYGELLEKEHLEELHWNHTSGLGVFMGIHLLELAFAEQARAHHQFEWRLPPKLKATWKVMIAPSRKESKEEATQEQESRIQPQLAPERSSTQTSFKTGVPRSNRPVVAWRSQSSALVNRTIWVEVPNRENILAMQCNVVCLQVVLLGKVKIRRKRTETRKISECLQHWAGRAGPVVAMMRHVKRVKCIQRFFRWAIQNMAEVRASVEGDWLRLEAGLAAQMNGHQLPPHPQPHPEDSLHHLQSGRHLHKQPAIHPAPVSSQNLGAAEVSHPSDVRKPPRHGLSVEQPGIQAADSKLRSHTKQDVPGNLLMSEERRQQALKLYLHKLRRKYLTLYKVWECDVQTWWQEVYKWRDHRKDCKSRGVKPSKECPSLPPCPPFRPTDDELLEAIQEALARKAVPKAKTTQTTHRQAGLGRVGRLAEAEALTAVPKRGKEEVFEATPIVGNNVLCEEVSGILAPTASRPVPVGNAGVHRPAIPSLF